MNETRLTNIGLLLSEFSLFLVDKTSVSSVLLNTYSL